MTKEERIKLISLAADVVKYYAPPSSFLEYCNLTDAEIILINEDDQSEQAADLICTEIFRRTGKKPLVKKEYFANFLTPYENQKFLVSCDYNAEFFRKNKFEKKTIIIASRKVQLKMMCDFRTEMKEFSLQILALENILESKYQKIKTAMLTDTSLPCADGAIPKDLSSGKNFRISLKKAASIMFLADDYDVLPEAAAIYYGENLLNKTQPAVICLDNIYDYHDKMMEKVKKTALQLRMYHDVLLVDRVEKSRDEICDADIARTILKNYVGGKNNIIVLSASKSTLVKELEQAVDAAGLSKNDFSFCIINPALQNLSQRQEYYLLAQAYRLQREHPDWPEPPMWNDFIDLTLKFYFVQPGKYKKMWFDFLEFRSACFILKQIVLDYNAFINKN